MPKNGISRVLFKLRKRAKGGQAALAQRVCDTAAAAVSLAPLLVSLASVLLVVHPLLLISHPHHVGYVGVGWQQQPLPLPSICPLPLLLPSPECIVSARPSAFMQSIKYARSRRSIKIAPHSQLQRCSTPTHIINRFERMPQEIAIDLFVKCNNMIIIPYVLDQNNIRL